MKKTISALMVAVSAVAFSASANAADYTPYVGVDYVNSHVYSKNLQNASFNVGTKYNKHFGTEIFYQTPLESKTWNTHEVDDDDNVSVIKNKVSYRSYGLDAYGYLPLGCDQVWSVLGTAGIAQVDTRYKETGYKSEKENGWAYRIGAGVQYDVTENWAVRVLARYSFLDKVHKTDHMMDVTAGVRYSF